MKLPLSKLLSVKLKYTFLQNGSIYWQRKIPKDLQPRYGSAAPLKINLETTDWRIAARKVHRLNEEHESLWESMRGNPDLQPRQIQEAAKGLLQQYQLKPYPIPNDDEALPALDAILFLHPRKSQIDVVQSVGRVMRRAEGKNMGYVILPIGVPAGVTPEEALNDNEKYRVVWQILNALRAHDDRFDATINKMDLGADVSSHIEIIAVANSIPEKTENNKNGTNIGAGGGNDRDNESFDGKGDKQTSVQTSFVFDEFQKAIYAKIVQKCGKRDYWENWANDIARIAQTHITRITALLQNKNSKEYAAFAEFLEELRDDLNESITEQEAIEMLAQHIITKPVFDALFEGYSFTQHNPVSMAMQSVLDVLQEQNLEKEAESLQKFYDSVKMRAAGIDNAAGKQRIIVELYDKFFRNAFPKMTERLGIVYTPVEVVDFIIHSVNDVLQSEFGQTLGSKNVHIIDPFTGTGTFVTRLLESGLISKDELAHKYQNEIHANEIVLLAYYIAAINIEAVYHSIMGGEYQPFNGICLTDTFQLHEKEDLVSHMLEANSSRRKKQKALDIRVIIGNPPYSAGQNSANDNNANLAYPKLDESIRTTYAAHSNAANKNALYDSYIRAIRWASNRIGNSGVIGFVSNGGFIEANTADGLRKCLADEFSSIYVFNLRGNLWAIETMHDAAYPLKLFQRVITVSLETMKIVRALPRLDIAVSQSQ